MSSLSQGAPVAVAGATGHTARFVLDELDRRGFRPILIGRDPEKLAAAVSRFPGTATRLADCGDARSLDAAIDGASAVVNCAGPFVDTAVAVAEAAIRARIPYLDLAAEQAAVRSVYALDSRARHAGVPLLPAAAFFGGLADLLASALLGGESAARAISVAVALDSWQPTLGTRKTGARNTERRVVIRDGALAPFDESQPGRSWTFPGPLGERSVEAVPLSEMLTLSHHIAATSIDSWIDAAAIRDVASPATPPPAAADARGRSAQTFVMRVLVETETGARSATASGRDIYAVSAPIVVEALYRSLESDAATIAGARSLGEIFDARDFLAVLVRSDALRVGYQTASRPLVTTSGESARLAAGLS